MSKGLPSWFKALFTLTMLVLCFVVVTQLIQQRNAQLQIIDLQNKIETSEKRMQKQQAEYEEYVTELPQVEAELAIVAPKAETVAERVDALKEERKALRAENEMLAASISELEAQSAAANTDFNADTQGITQQLETAIQTLDGLLEILRDSTP